jgi:glutamate/tyrosine decarboxylase-like PLP-dependent enzyme
MMLLGENGYSRITNEAWTAFDLTRKGIEQIEGFKIVGKPDACCIAIQCSDGAENKIYKIAGALKKHFGWRCHFFFFFFQCL